jgi:hypothetical protein
MYFTPRIVVYVLSDSLLYVSLNGHHLVCHIPTSIKLIVYSSAILQYVRPIGETSLCDYFNIFIVEIPSFSLYGHPDWLSL